MPTHHEFPPIDQVMKDASISLQKGLIDDRMDSEKLLRYAFEGNRRLRPDDKVKALNEVQEILKENRLVEFVADKEVVEHILGAMSPVLDAAHNASPYFESTLTGQAALRIRNATEVEKGYLIRMSKSQLQAFSVFASFQPNVDREHLLGLNEGFLGASNICTDIYLHMIGKNLRKKTE